MTHSKYPSLAAIWSGVSPCMLTEEREQPAFNTSSAISTFPAYAAQWRHTFSSWKEGGKEGTGWSNNLKSFYAATSAISVCILCPSPLLSGQMSFFPVNSHQTQLLWLNWPLENYLIVNGDIRSSVQQHFNHLDVFVLGSPDDRRPAPVVLNPTKKRSVTWTSSKTDVMPAASVIVP